MPDLQSLKQVLPLWSDVPATIQCPSCSARIEVAVNTCSACGGDVVVECRECGNTIRTDTETCPACNESDFEAFLVD